MRCYSAVPSTARRWLLVSAALLYFSAVSALRLETLCPTECQNGEVRAARAYQDCLLDPERVEGLPPAVQRQNRKDCGQQLKRHYFAHSFRCLEFATTRKKPKPRPLRRTIQHCLQQDLSPPDCDQLLQDIICPVKRLGETTDSVAGSHDDDDACCDMREKPGKYGNRFCFGEAAACCPNGEWQCPVVFGNEALYRCGNDLTTHPAGPICAHPPDTECLPETRTCPDGTVVQRQPEYHCRFAPCCCHPADAPTNGECQYGDGIPRCCASGEWSCPLEDGQTFLCNGGQEPTRKGPFGKMCNTTAP